MQTPAETPASNTRVAITDKTAGVITRIEELSYDLKVSEVMTKDLKVVSPELSMANVVEMLREARISGAPVVVEGRLVGVISIEDAIRALRQNDLEAPVRDYMAFKGLITARAADPVVEALKTFGTRNVGRLPVLDDGGCLVGILTKGDITDGVLRALQKDYQAEEVRRYRASHLFDDLVSDRTSLILRYDIKARDFTRGGQASSNIKHALLRLGASTQVARRCGIAVYEAEINLIIHTTLGGTIRVEIEPHSIKIQVVDQGPGIPDVSLARKPGYSTATDEVREMGFGAGMGLVNIERCVDQMELTSTVGVGTRLTMRIDLSEEADGPHA
jgi:CBS domain-containing protein/anti-sigma regulatory factor (Ser/Thr protein kinase)